MAAFVSLLEAKAKDAQPLHDPLPSCTTLFLAGSDPATYGHKTIALTTELKEPYLLGQS